MDFRRAGLALTVLLAAYAAAAGPSWAGAPVKRNATTSPARGARGAGVESIQRPNRIQTLEAERRIDVNRINMFVSNYGSFAWDLGGGGSPPGLYFPKGTNKTAVFASGLWMGAEVNGDPSDFRTVVAEYSQEYGPGAMIAGTFDDPSKPEYITYKVVRFTGDLDAVEGDTAHVEREPNESTREDELVHHSWSEYMAGAAPHGAPWKNYRLPNPAIPGDSVDVPGPDVAGDMMLWAVYNDADPSNHTNDAGSSTPLGVEIQQTTFAFNRQGALGNVLFLSWKVINKGTNTLDNMFVSMWSDPDLGGAADDLVGCDTTLSLGFTYNSTNNDQLYGSAPPAVGYDFFQGPIVAGSPLPMTSFNKYINGTDPASTTDTYNYMKGLLPDGSEVIDPTTGNPTKFFHPGDPTTRTGWLDSSPADRRHLLTSGPFTMVPGDTQVIVGAIIIGDGNDRLSSIDAMKFYDDFAQLAFDEGFQLPNPPPQPKVSAQVDHGSVTLSWDAAARNNYTEPGYAFEGYIVYQGASQSGPWKRLATFDEINGILTVRDTVFDIVTGRTITDFPVAFGTDAGVRFTYNTTVDAIRGGDLKDGTEYYFAVTAYAYSATEKAAVLENAQTAVRVIPQRPAPGTDVGTASATVTQSRVDPLRPPATDNVEVTVVDAAAVNGHDYRVTFTPLFPPFPQSPGGEDIRDAWNLTDVTTGDTILFRQLNRSGDDDYEVVDGLLIKVIGAFVPAFQDAAYLNNVAAHRRALEGVNFGLASFNGGGDVAFNFFGSTLDPTAMPDSFTTVEIRFSQTATQLAHRFVRMQTLAGAAPASYPDRGYLNRGYLPVPWQAWDATNEVQLDAAFLEKEVTDDAGVRLPESDQLATGDSTWAADASTDGGREYIFVYRRPYSPTPRPELAVDGSVLAGTVPLLYTVAPKLRAATDVIDDGDAIRFTWANPATSNDVYDIETSTLVRNDNAVAAGKLQGVRAVPNPYYNRSRYELNQFERVIRFINMPETATVRIFNLGGQLVRTLQKTDITTSVLSWDIETDNQLPVASGVYIFHVESSSGESTFGRLVVFMEKERLNNF